LRWKCGAAVVALFAVTGCSMIHQMPPSDLDASVSAPDTSKVGRSLEPGRWYSFRGYTDSRGEWQPVSGRVRVIPGDSLEFDSYSSSSWSLAPRSHRSIVPRDSVRELRVLELDAGQSSIVVAGIATVVILFVVAMDQLNNALGHLAIDVSTH
jgi:hypothetical protein